jgi:outer membrane protein assembly factor BamC
MLSMRFFLGCLMGALVLAVAGCTTTIASKIDYKSAGKLPPLEVPPDLTQPSVDDRYAVPDISPSGVATYSAYARERSAGPQQAGLAPKAVADTAHIERAGTQRWLVVQAPPSQAWGVARDFWQENGFIIIDENQETGVMETDWAENRAKIPGDPIRNFFGKALDVLYSTGERDKFRTRFERGADGQSTEIYISHRGMVEVAEGVDTATGDAQRTIWQPRPSDPELEAEMLTRLMMRFGVEESRARSQIASPRGSERAKLVKEQGGTGMLVVNDPFDRAWRRIGLALDRVGFTVEDRDRVQGVYFVRYLDPSLEAKPEKKGILSNLAFWSSDKKPEPQQYRILVTEAAEKSEVTVLNTKGSKETGEVGGRILTLLYEQLR